MRTSEETNLLLDKLAESQMQMEALFKRIEEAQLNTEIQNAKTEAQIAKTEAQLAKTDAKLWSIGVNLGHTAEEFFYYSLEEKPRLGTIKFDEVVANLKGKSKQVEDEFDIVLYNGNSIAIIEIKHKVHPNDLVKLKDKKASNFRHLFPDYKDYKIYLGIGGFSVPKEVAASAIKSGIAVLRQKGDLADIKADQLSIF